ncbi:MULTISPECIES: hypothetical protein [unclassified Rathayibacter]|uniref:hypothetical protein n=1 Tax=unclassified Rathayibacter TaxID=2609250 RepID=UPI00188BDAE4|nr:MULTISPECIES: hypothetical protein [unclassified Rathayibacter]MBF4463458.1 hypothetical protein [Rathayibacter sp. VKM Ac-2879]MBF4504819.1 hypothetical protein [Rathayibacter sp. VKM Ac-2878]
MDRRFAVDNVDVIQVRASIGGSEPHLQYNVTYEPKSRPSELGSFYPVVASLHAADEDGWGDVSIGAFLLPLGEVPDGIPLSEVLADDAAIETLYDIARTHLRHVLATVGCLTQLPKQAPEAEFSEQDGVVQETEPDEPTS